VGLIGGDFQHLLPLHQTIAAQQNQECINGYAMIGGSTHTKAEQALARLSDLLKLSPTELNAIIVDFWRSRNGKDKDLLFLRLFVVDIL
jgi:hypothetical protein